MTKSETVELLSLRSRMVHLLGKKDDDLENISDENEDDYDDDDDDADDDDYDPLANGVDSVSWLPPLSFMTSSSSFSATSSAAKESEILPFFPLGGIVYTPNSEHVLNIFEPRYRQMYTDILMNGSKRFVVAMSHPEKPGTFAETGVIFYLDDLKEVSEETGDQIKYICNHKVTKRVKIHKVLNPEAWSSRNTYLRVEGTILDDDDDDKQVEDLSGVESDDENVQNIDVYQQLVESMSSSSYKPKLPHEKALMKSFQELVDKQHELEEDVRFTRASVSNLALAPGDGQDSLWMTIRLWQSFIEQRLVARQNEMQMEFQEKLLEFLRNEKGLKENELPSTIGFNDLSPALQNEVQDLQKRMATELRPLVLESTLAIQKILEAENHEERCKLLKYFMDAEKQRLDAKKQLRGMFQGKKDGDAESIGTFQLDTLGSQVEDKDDEDDDDDDGPSPSSSLLVDEPDSFQ